MKLSCIDDNIVIFINEQLNFDDIEQIKEYLKQIFLNIKDKININGFYDSFIYKDINYGIVIELIKDNDEYFDYLDEIDMHITLENITFLYKIEDIFIDKELIDNSTIYMFDNNYYLKLKNKLNEILQAKLLEIGELIYKNTNIILNYDKKINYMI